MLRGERMPHDGTCVLSERKTNAFYQKQKGKMTKISLNAFEEFIFETERWISAADKW